MTSTGRRIASITAVALLGLAAIVGMLKTSVDTNKDETTEVIPSLSSSPSSQSAAPELPDEDFRFALRELCASNAEQSGDDNWSPEEVQAQREAFNELKRSLSNRLSVSSSAEHLHLAALLASGSESRVELIDRAVSQNPNDAFVLWGAVQICTEKRIAPHCPLRDWEQRLLEIDGQNSESWVRVAANRYRADDLDSALDALRYAATSAETRAYWTETIEMIERGFAAASDYAFPVRAQMAFGIAASMLPHYGDYVRMCRKQSAKNVDWAYACLAYGELVENQGKTAIGVSIARSIQKLALETLGEVDKLAAVEQRQEADRQKMLDSVGDNYAVTVRLMFSNPALFSAYLAAVRTHGESGARAYLAEEARRLLQQQPELACAP